MLLHLFFCASAYGGGRGGVGLASDKQHFPKASAKHANQEKMSAERKRCPTAHQTAIVPSRSPQAQGGCMSSLIVPPCSPQALDVRGGESQRVSSASTQTTAKPRYFEIATFMATFIQSRYTPQRHFSRILDQNTETHHLGNGRNDLEQPVWLKSLHQKTLRCAVVVIVDLGNELSAAIRTNRLRASQGVTVPCFAVDASLENGAPCTPNRSASTLKK